MAGKVFSVTAILGVNSKRLAVGLKAAAARMIAWARTVMAKVGRLIRNGMLIAGAAVAYFAYKSIREFSKFEKGMNEVFTLVPGMSKKAMGQMGDQALSLAKKMGVLPEEVVPALYQALSAGIPPNNVFSFMQTAIMAGKAGVSDTETAVKALSSVVNTYGAENITAAQVADMMFATVKGGVTTFEQLSATLYNVLPIANAAGIGFEQISAATAVMTKRGTPTAQTMTQLKAAIQSIIAPSTRSAKWFAKYGLSISHLKKVMAGPGGLVKAMNMIKVATNGDMQAMRKLLGSVEAISGVLTLTSDDGREFAQMLHGITTQTGQMPTAFQQMDQGLSRSFEKMHASLKVAMIKFGKALAPLIHKITPIFTRIIAGIDGINWAKIINGFAHVWVRGLKPTFDAVMNAIRSMPWMDLWNFLLPIAKLIIVTIQKIGQIIVGLSPMIIPLLTTLAGYFTLLYSKFFLVVHFLSKVAGHIGAVWQDVLEIISAAMGFLIDPSAAKFKWLVEYITLRMYFLKDSIKSIWFKIWDVIKEALGKIVGGVESAFTTLVKTIWEKLGSLLASIPGFSEAIGEIVRAFKTIKNELMGEIAALVGAYGDMTGAVEGNVKGTVWWKKALEFLIESLGTIIVLTVKFVSSLMKLLGMIVKIGVRLLTELAPALSELLPLAFKIAAAFIFFFIEGLKASIMILTKVVQAILYLEPAFMFIVSIVSGFVAAVVEGLKAIWGTLKWLYFGIKEIFGSGAELMVEGFYMVKDVITGVIDFIIGLFQKLKDFIYWVLFGGTITKDFKRAFEFIEKLVRAVLETIFKIFQTFKEVVGVVLQGIADIFTIVFEGIVSVVESMGKAVERVFDSMGRLVKTLLKAFTDMGKVIEKIFGKVMKIGGKALELAGKAVGAVGGAIGGALEWAGVGGGSGKGKGVSAQITTGSFRTSLKPIVTKLTSMDGTLKSIDRTLKGRFTNQ